jgi:hypothetical protein
MAIFCNFEDFSVLFLVKFDPMIKFDQKLSELRIMSKS